MKTKVTLKNNDIGRFASDSALNFIWAMFANADRINEGENIELLHDMRVASRRLRECFQLFQPFYAEKKLEKTLVRVKKVTRTLGIPREMDVNVSVLKAYKPKRSSVVRTTHEYLLEIFEFEQARQRKKMLKAFDKLDLKTLQSELIQSAQTPLAKSTNSHLLALVHQDVELEAFLKRATQCLKEKVTPILTFQSSTASSQTSDDDVLHRLRINVKKCRYCLEILNPLYASRFDRGIELARELQDILGKIHDLAVLIGCLDTHGIHLMEKTRFSLARGCQRIVGNLGELKQALLPQVEPAYKAFVDELCRRLPVEQESQGPIQGRVESGIQGPSSVEKQNATSPTKRASDLLTSTQNTDQETASASAGGAGTKLHQQ